MDLLGMFRRNQDTATVKEILNTDAARRVTDSFITDHLDQAKGVIIIWIENGELKYDAGGMNDFEAQTSLFTIMHSISHNGLPR